MSITAIRFRATAEGLCVLQVQEHESGSSYNYRSEPKWRDAKVEDLLDVSRFCVDNNSEVAALNHRVCNLESRLQSKPEFIEQ